MTAIEQGRKQAEALYFEGVRCMEAGEDTRAEDCFREALQFAPELAEACLNLGFLANRRGDAEAAESCYRHAVALDPSCPQGHLNLGAILADKKRFAEAEAAYSQAIALRPDAAAGWSNLGALYACMKRETEAEQCLRQAIALDKDYANARFNLGYLLLRQGKFEEGWHCLEARNWYAPLAAQLSCPLWQGEALAGKSLLVGYEAGHGDMIQFCRYLPLLKQQGVASISMICHPALKPLFEALPEVDELIGFDEPLPDRNWDFWIPLLSIPHRFNTRIDTIPAKIPYLQAPAERIEKWAPLLPDGFRVGLVWKGNPRFENDADRSLPSLGVLAPLADVSGVRFVSLQKGAGEAEAAHPPAGFPILDLGTRLQDFADSAAIVAQLDLVISVDTAVAHLAGALGKPCWLMLPEYKPDWRWLTERNDTPWYPAMRLFRQHAMGEWNPVVAELVAALGQAVRIAADIQLPT